MNKCSLFWFRRDLRLEDNRALLECAKNSESVLLIFIFDEYITQKLPKDDKRLGFIVHHLHKLQKELQKRNSDLYIFYGKPENIIPKLCREHKIEAVYTARAHSSYGKIRDKNIREWCFDNFIDFQDPEDTLIVDTNIIPPKKVFSAFFRCWNTAKKYIPQQALQSIPPVPKENICNNWKAVLDNFSYSGFNDWNEKNAQNILKSFDWQNYSSTRDFPYLQGTSKLSVLLRFGIISTRKFYHHIKNLPYDTEQLEKEIAWKEFWYHIAQHFPESLEQEFQAKRQNIPWENNAEYFQAWCEGKTGYPIVDAAMRQLNTEGWMHGRCRMIVASFLSKDLLIDWRWGRFFIWW
jgi:deoxyribodipyrimidine photo-lyase